MKKILFLSILLMMFVVNLDITKAQTETIILQYAYAENLGDVFVSKNDRDKNWGSADTIAVSGVVSSYMMFDISPIPSGVIIENATLYLFCVDSESSGNVNLYHVFDHTWDGHNEYDLTWNNQPCTNGIVENDPTDCNTTMEYRIKESGKQKWYNISASNAVSQEYYDGSEIVSFFLNATALVMNWWSKEYSATTQRPFLQIIYTFPQTTTTSTTTIPFNYTEFMELKEVVEELKNQTQSNTQRIVDLETVVDWILGQIDSIWNVLKQPRILTPANATYPYEIIELKVSGTDVDTWWYRLNDGEETVFTPPVNITGIEGTNKLIIFANYTDGSIHSDTVYFTVHPGDLLPNNVVDIFDIVYMAGRYGDRY